MTPLSITIRKDFSLSLYGFSGVAARQDWAGTGRHLMNRLWQEVRSRQLATDGINIWVYDEDSQLFTGVGLTAPPPAGSPFTGQAIVNSQHSSMVLEPSWMSVSIADWRQKWVLNLALRSRSMPAAAPDLTPMVSTMPAIQ